MRRSGQLRLRAVLTFALVLTAAAGFLLWRLADHDLDRRNSERFDFVSAGAPVSGTLWLPDETPRAAVVLVHGDGAQDRTSEGGYAPLINAMLDRGIAVASWDKPGVGSSAGNWLQQTMEERADETRIALQLLARRFDGLVHGAVGFSQAGWVLPQLSSNDADFVVLVGAAVSWQDQGDYYTRTRLAREGLDPPAVDLAIAEQKLEDARIFGPEAASAPAGMPADRWQFIRINRYADARAALARLDLPLLAIWGANDLNVEPERNAAIFGEFVSGRNSHSEIIIWPGATHGLLKSSAYNWQLADDWSRFAIMRFVLEGRHAFAPGALDTITEWILARGKFGASVRQPS
ncbi:alpha/beta hydrolase (plasmid) [Martelella lutilitoris]|uniref:Alpha/beta hydrolase n=1 Tax=Martelella lutilitoris TaxID=2583532 RepID=A0A7T7KNP7_9HYPH|nr:alpha/beta hydrolase [Martelella lutilitoris]QRX65361.1 alpha/beta hydrolase [Dysgonomonadaceae bacterium zrk40]